MSSRCYHEPKFKDRDRRDRIDNHHQTHLEEYMATKKKASKKTAKKAKKK
jgi:hypothetical protein